MIQDLRKTISFTSNSFTMALAPRGPQPPAIPVGLGRRPERKWGPARVPRADGADHGRHDACPYWCWTQGMGMGEWDDWIVIMDHSPPTKHQLLQTRTEHTMNMLLYCLFSSTSAVIWFFCSIEIDMWKTVYVFCNQCGCSVLLQWLDYLDCQPASSSQRQGQRRHLLTCL